MRAPLRGAFSLAEIFFGPFANLFRQRRARRVPGRRIAFESLEGRILLSADLVGAELLNPAEPSTQPPAVERSIEDHANFRFDAPANTSADSFTLRFNASSGDLELLEGTSVVLSQSLAATSGVVINGEDAHDDILTIDFSFGGFFSVAGGITFDGGADGIDKLSVTGGDFVSATHTSTTTGPGRSGTLVYDDGAHPALVVDYANLEPVDMSGSTISKLVFNLPGANDQAILEDDGVAGNGISRIRSQSAVPTFETTTFSNTATSVTVNMGADSGSFTVASLPDFTGSLTLNGQSGADTVMFTGTTGFNALSVAVAGGIADSAATSLTVAGNASFSGGNITLGDNAADTTNFGTLTFSSGGAVSITEDSDTTLTGSSTAGSVSLTSAGSITDGDGGTAIGAGDVDVTTSTLTLTGQSIGAAGGELDIAVDRKSVV